MTDEEHYARAALLGAEYIPTAQVYRQRLGYNTYHNCADFRYLHCDTLEVLIERRSELDAPYYEQVNTRILAQSN